MSTTKAGRLTLPEIGDKILTIPDIARTDCVQVFNQYGCDKGTTSRLTWKEYGQLGFYPP